MLWRERVNGIRVRIIIRRRLVFNLDGVIVAVTIRADSRRLLIEQLLQEAPGGVVILAQRERDRLGRHTIFRLVCSPLALGVRPQRRDDLLAGSASGDFLCLAFHAPEQRLGVALQREHGVVFVITSAAVQLHNAIRRPHDDGIAHTREQPHAGVDLIKGIFGRALA